MAIPEQIATPIAGVTANGTAYMQYSVRPAASMDPAYILVPSTVSVDGGSTSPLLWLHGRGGSRDTINGSTVIPVRDGLIDAGFVIVLPNMHGNQWGNEVAQSDIRALTSLVATVWTIPKWLILGVSMGGGTAANAIARASLPNVGALILISPALNVQAMFNITAEHPYVLAAFGAAEDGSDILAKSEGYDPVRNPVTAFAGVPVLAYASVTDATTVKVNNLDPFMVRVAPVAQSYDFVTVTGGHLAADHYRVQPTVSFLLEAIAPPVAAVAGAVNLFIDGSWQPFTPHAVVDGEWVEVGITLIS